MKIGSVTLDLFLAHAHNDPYATERMIEVPLARWFIAHHNHAIMELGAVTPYYDQPQHEVIDPFDPWPNCIRKKAAECDFLNKNALSISTIEHIGHGEYNQQKNPQDAHDILDNLRKAASYLVTWPAGFHIELDNYVQAASDVIRLKRTAFQNWEVAANLEGVKYLSPWHCGNGLFIITNCKELLC